MTLRPAIITGPHMSNTPILDFLLSCVYPEEVGSDLIKHHVNAHVSIVYYGKLYGSIEIAVERELREAEF